MGSAVLNEIDEELSSDSEASDFTNFINDRKKGSDGFYREDVKPLIFEYAYNKRLLHEKAYEMISELENENAQELADRKRRAEELDELAGGLKGLF